MNKKILNYQIVSVVFVSILGTLLHFTFDWSNGNYFVGAFSAVNESTWEHLKLLFFPMLITTIVGSFYIGKNVKNFLCAKVIGILTAVSFTIVFFYTSGGIIGSNIAALNIVTFFIAVILGEYVSYRIILSNLKCNKKVAIITLIILFICLVRFTFYAPQIGLFKDPITGEYGIIRANNME